MMCPFLGRTRQTILCTNLSANPKSRGCGAKEVGQDLISIGYWILTRNFLNLVKYFVSRGHDWYWDWVKSKSFRIKVINKKMCIILASKSNKLIAWWLTEREEKVLLLLRRARKLTGNEFCSIVRRGGYTHLGFGLFGGYDEKWYLPNINIR